MKVRKIPKRKFLLSSGNLLIGDYQSSQIAIATVDNLKHLANRTERAALKQLSSITSGNQVYIIPEDIPEEMRKYYTHASLNAHLQRIQANQIEVHNLEQLKSLSLEAEQKYLKHKVKVEALDKRLKPILTCLRRKGSGQEYIAPRSPRAAKGKIKVIDLQKNYMIIRPTLTARAFNSSLQYYIVRIINPEFFEPMVRLFIA